MTKLALFSDIHANFPALRAVLEDFQRTEPDMAFCLGDLVGYGPWANEVVETLRSRWIPTIAGNYDVGVGRNSNECGCAYETETAEERGEASIRWTNAEIEESNRRYLDGLPRHLRVELGESGRGPELLMVHGSPRRVNEYLYEDRPDATFRRLLEEFEADVLAFGHTHIPYERSVPGDEDGGGLAGRVVNTGSVGKPKDGDPRACYALLRIEEGQPVEIEVEFVRVDYDVERAARAVERSGLPDAYADMLRDGRS